MWRKITMTAAAATIAVSGLMLTPVLPLPVAHATTRYPNQITLSTETPFYASPNSNEAPVGRISPQSVYILGEQPSRSADGPRWYQVQTWLGPKWVQLTDQIFLGQPDLVDTQIAILRETPLYNLPLAGTASGATLSPQTVFANYRCGDYFEISTWLGNKWIRLNDDMVLDVKPGASLVLSGTTPLFDRPSADSQMVAELSPQAMDAFEQVDGWYHVKTWLGDEWLNPNIYIPTGVTKTDEPIELWQPTKFYAYPSFDDGVKGVVSPQTVQAFEQVGNWFHVHSDWLGDSWLYRVPNPNKYVPPANPLVKVDTEWKSIQLDIGASGIMDYPLAANMFTGGMNIDQMGNQTLSYNRDLSIQLELMHLGDQQAITVKKPITFGLDIYRLIGQKRELVWTTTFSPLEGTLSRRGSVYSSNSIVWKRTDANGNLLPPGKYELRLTPDQTSYTIDNKDYVQQWNQNSFWVRQTFDLVAP